MRLPVREFIHGRYGEGIVTGKIFIMQIVTYQDVVTEVWRVPPHQLKLLFNFLHLLQESSSSPIPSDAISKEDRVPKLKSRPIQALAPSIGSLHLGEINAFEECERLNE